MGRREVQIMKENLQEETLEQGSLECSGETLLGLEVDGVGSTKSQGQRADMAEHAPHWCPSHVNVQETYLGNKAAKLPGPVA